jgi:hypothetical protein
MFVLAVTQPATDEANATSANPRDIRLAASTHVFGMRDPPGRFTSTARFRFPNHASE